MSADHEPHYSAYENNLKELRNWFIAYGVGGPILLLSNKDIYPKVAEHPHTAWIALAFTVGVASQIFIAFINKWNNWFLYRHYESQQGGNTKDSSCLVNFSKWLNDQVWLDISFDLISIAAFGYATFMTLQILL